MKIYLIVGQRKESSCGDVMPEVLDAIDEYGYDENPAEWLRLRLEEHRTDTSFENIQVIVVDVPLKEVMKVLRPIANVIPCKVV
jgi:hypothetical protein